MEPRYLNGVFEKSAYDFLQVDNLGFGVDKREALEEQLSNGHITFRYVNASIQEM